MKQYFLIIILVFGLYSNFVFANTDQATGLIPGSIWYSTEPLIEGETVKIYTAVWNADDKPLQARVEFYDKKVILGTRDILVEKMSLKDVSISWKVTAGDHLISAKIISSNTTTGGKTEKVSIERSSTETDKVFVPVSTKSPVEEDTSSAKVVKDQVSKATENINSIIPESVASSISETISPIESMRVKVDEQIDLNKEQTKKEIDSFKKIDDPKTVIGEGSKPLDATEKPIAYIKLFILSIIGFIFGHPIIFYGLAIAISFWILRFIYRKIRHRK